MFLWITLRLFQSGIDLGKDILRWFNLKEISLFERPPGDVERGDQITPSNGGANILAGHCNSFPPTPAKYKVHFAEVMCQEMTLLGGS